MKSKFPGHYSPAISFDAALQDALVVFDTNVLLNFYELGPTTRAKFFETLLKIKDRCWLPYHVALEFHRNRVGRVEEALKNHATAIKRVRGLVGDITLDIEKQDVLKNSAETSTLIEAFKNAAHDLVTHAEEAAKQLPQRSSEDPVNEFLAELFDERVGSPPTQEIIDAWNKEGQRRFEHKHPPGFTDAKDKASEKFMDRDIAYLGMYGDLYIWKQILNHINSVPNNKFLIFVTDERKPDWWAKNGDKILGPAPQLSQELALSAPGWNLRMYRSPPFFEQLFPALGSKLSAEEIEEMQEASSSSWTHAFNIAFNETFKAKSVRHGMSMLQEEIPNPRQLFAAYQQWIRKLSPPDQDLSYSYLNDDHALMTVRDGAGSVEEFHIILLGKRTSLLPTDLLNQIEYAASMSQGVSTNLAFDTTGLSDEVRDRVHEQLLSMLPYHPNEDLRNVEIFVSKVTKGHVEAALLT